MTRGITSDDIGDCFTARRIVAWGITSDDIGDCSTPRRIVAWGFTSGDIGGCSTTRRVVAWGFGDCNHIARDWTSAVVDLSGEL